MDKKEKPSQKEDSAGKKSPTYTPNPDYDYMKSSSTTDCTGSVPRPPETDAELDSYLDVYNFLPQSSITNKRNDA